MNTKANEIKKMQFEKLYMFQKGSTGNIYDYGNMILFMVYDQGTFDNANFYFIGRAATSF